MNKFMKHQKLQFKPGSFRLNGLFRVVFLICCLLSAGLTQAQEKKITAEFKDTPLSNVLKQLEKLSTYKILFTYDDVQSYKVTVSLKDATITEALQKVNLLFSRMWRMGNIYRSSTNPRKSLIPRKRSREKSWIVKEKQLSGQRSGW